ncbi:MAG TPA: thioredoxin domain-containing protein [Blastocatellia bacterium]|nr:thioredoxin domain-containing protein [Blastocatellia bacterium]
MKILLSFVAAALIGFAPEARSQAAANASPSASTQAQKPAAEKKGEDCGCNGQIPADALAVVNGVKISPQEIDDKIKDQIKQIEDQVVEARKRALDLQINTVLLDEEAKRRGISSAKLLELEVLSKVKPPTESDAQAFYDQNKERMQGSFDEIKGDIINYLLNKRQSEEAARFAARLRSAAQVKILDPNVTPPASEAERGRVFATLNGRPITSADIEDSLKPLIFEAQEEIYNLRKNQLDLRINDLLLEQEAQKRKISPAAVFEQEITPRMKLVSEEDARAFYDRNKERINGDFDQLKGQIIEYLQQVERREKEGEFAEMLRKAATIQVYLKEPEQPVYEISTEDQPSRGNPSAPVTIVEFTDFECPACASVQPALDAIAAEYGDKVRLVVRDFPLDQHPNAAKAAEAAEAAREQGKYWEYVALLFQHQKDLGPDKLKEYASQAGLDRKKFDEALDSGKYSDRVRTDVIEGTRLGVDSTPTVFVNGKKIKEKTSESLKAAIEAALKTTPKK